MYKNIYKLCERIVEGDKRKCYRSLATYMQNIYGYEDMYNNECIISEIITKDLIVNVLFVEDKEICTSSIIKHFAEDADTRDFLVFSVRKDFDSMTNREKVITITRIVNTIVRTIYGTDINSTLSILNFYTQTIMACLVLRDIMDISEIVSAITEKYKDETEVVRDITTICEYLKDKTDIDNEIYNLVTLGGVVTLLSKSREDNKDA